ncbi:thiamine pyrophosphate-binding protein [Azospirillum sp. B506]|uniref:thiamine pyrophosphate-binding protein n=1 Tax=Azospirillum sp. B506 TaxID=137721 RepID=UPI000348212D|nr:thiamine pyrophosphate-binding protein [Azospirillum sp. B506]
MTIRVSDYIAAFIADTLGLRDVFLVSGAGIMHLTDSIARHPDLRAVCLHHEQSAAMALDAYARINGHFAVGCFTTGPGATNAITGLVGAWQDSVPCLFLSGQVKLAAASHIAGVPGLRQFGVQELDIVPIVSSISKHAVMLTDPLRIRYELERAVHIARSGRPGPVWIDIPMDVQAAWVEPENLVGYGTEEDGSGVPLPAREDVAQAARDDFVRAAPGHSMRAAPGEVAQAWQRLCRAERPVIIAGQGVRLAGACDALRNLAERHTIPVVTPYLGLDVMSHDLPVYIGKPGVRGDRAANYAMQNADLILAIGTSLPVSVIGYDPAGFARAATRIVVDIDPTAHRKPTIAIDQLLVADAKSFIDRLLEEAEHAATPAQPSARAAWLARCTDWKTRYRADVPDPADSIGGVHSHGLIAALSRRSQEGDIFVCDTGTAMYATAQAIRLTRPGQRFITSGGMACMGYTLPAAIGAAFAGGERRVLAITGDGSLQMNVQELQTLFHHRLPVKLFVLNNAGYLSIRSTQQRYFAGRLIGEGAESGISMPDTLKLCAAYGLPAERVSSLAELDDALERVLAVPGPFVVDVVMPADQPVIPALSSRIEADGSMSSSPLEDMYPFLPRTEHRANMLIDQAPLRKGKVGDA